MAFVVTVNKRKLTSKKRDAQHAYASKSTLPVKNGRFDMSAAAEHAIFEQHAVDIDNVEVIDYERQGMKRRVKDYGSSVSFHQRRGELDEQRPAEDWI